jgi:hypothetical protein
MWGLKHYCNANPRENGEENYEPTHEQGGERQ